MASRAQVNKMHMVKPGTLEREDRDRFFRALCDCGWKGGVYPGAEDAADALMQHSREMGYLAAQRDAMAMSASALNDDSVKGTE